jgi:hypothetical protein
MVTPDFAPPAYTPFADATPTRRATHRHDRHDEGGGDEVSVRLDGDGALEPDGEFEDEHDPLPVRYVNVTRDGVSHTYGFGFGTTTAGIKVVTTINQQLFADANPTADLNKGDVITEIDGREATSMTHAEAIEHFLSTTRVRLGIWANVHASLHEG